MTNTLEQTYRRPEPGGSSGPEFTDKKTGPKSSSDLGAQQVGVGLANKSPASWQNTYLHTLPGVPLSVCPPQDRIEPPEVYLPRVQVSCREAFCWNFSARCWSRCRRRISDSSQSS